MGILAKLWRDETAVMTAETALMVAMLSLASFATWRQLARTVEGRAEETSNIFQSNR
jgi:Flp pilus assembly pilin Flp